LLGSILMRVKKILVAFEKSGRVRDSFIQQGHRAISCDLLPSDRPGPHYQGNVWDIIDAEEWDMLIGFPVCTFMCNSGVQHLFRSHKRQRLMRKSVIEFNRLMDLPIEQICLENPIPHPYGLGSTYDQIIQPYQFGHMQQKSTCLWLRNLQLLKPTKNVYDKMMKLPVKERQKIWYASPGENRAEIRSRTFWGIARAMAKQWS